MDITINYGSDTYWCRGGIFVNLCIVFLIILTITGFGYTISYKNSGDKSVFIWTVDWMEQWSK